MVLLLVLLRQWRCTNCQASIHHQTIHTPLAHQTRGRTILPWSSRMVFDTHQGSHNGPHSQRSSRSPVGDNSFQTNKSCRCNIHRRTRSQSRYTPDSKVQSHTHPPRSQNSNLGDSSLEAVAQVGSQELG